MSLSFWTRSRRFSGIIGPAGAVVARQAGAIDELPRAADLDELAGLERLVVLPVLAVEDEHGAGLVQDEVVAGAHGIGGSGLGRAELHAAPLRVRSQLERLGRVEGLLGSAGGASEQLLRFGLGEAELIEVRLGDRQRLGALGVPGQDGLEELLAQFLRRQDDPLVDAAIAVLVEAPLGAVGPEPAVLVRLAGGGREDLAVGFHAVDVVSDDVVGLAVVAHELADGVAGRVADDVAERRLRVVLVRDRLDLALPEPARAWGC